MSSLDLVIRTGRSMADGLSLPRLITNELLWTSALRAYEKKSWELLSPGPRSRKSVQSQYRVDDACGDQRCLYFWNPDASRDITYN